MLFCINYPAWNGWKKSRMPEQKEGEVINEKCTKCEWKKQIDVAVYEGILSIFLVKTLT